MFYIRIADNQYPFTESQVRAAFPNTSFPKDLGAPEGYALIVFKPAPAVDQTRQQAIETTPALINGEYAQQWRVESLTAEVVEAKIEHAKTDYQRSRAAEYPPIGDQLDALWKGGTAAAEMLVLVQAVKTKYPKG